MSSKCSLITSKEVVKIGSLFSEFLENNLDKSKLDKDKSLFAKENLDIFFSKHLGPYLYDQLGRPLTTAEAEFLHTTLISLSGNKTVMYNTIAKNKDLQDYYEINEQTALNAFVFSLNFGGHLFDYTLKENPLVNTIISRLGTPTEETGLSIPRTTTDTPNIIKLVQSEKITKFTGLKNTSDISKAFMGSLSAQIAMEKMMHLNIVRRFMINKKDGVYNTTNQDIDKTIKDYKEQIFKEVVDFIKEKQNTGLNFAGTDNQLYIYNESGNTILNPNFKSIIDKVAKYYNEVVNLHNTTLESWKNTDELLKYIDFIIVANFDSILLDRGKEVFSISDSLYNSDSETKEQLKYSLNVKNKMSSFTFSTQESFLLLEEQSALYKMLLGAMPFITKNGDMSIVKEIDINSINGTIAKMFTLLNRDMNYDNTKSIPKYDKRNPLNSMKEVFEYVVKEYTNPKAFRTLPKELMGPELDLILSLYINFFRSEDGHKLSNVIGKSLYEKLTEQKSALKNQSILGYIGPSYYQLGGNTLRVKKTFGLDYTSVIVSNFDKTYFNNYTETTYDPNLQTLTINTPDSKLYEGDVAALKNNVNTISNYKFTKDLLAKDLLTDKNVKVDYDKGIVTLYDIGIDGIQKDLIINIGETGTTSVKLVRYIDGKPIEKDFNSKDISDQEIADILAPGSKFINLVDRNLPSINIATNGYLLESIRLILDEKSNGVRNTISTLARLTSGCILVKKISSETNNIDEILTKSKFIKTRKDSFTVINTKRNEVSVTSLNSLYGELITQVGRAITMSNGSMYRAVTKVANGTTMPLHGQVRHLYVVKDLVKSLIEDNEGKTKGLPLEGNFFMMNQHMITPTSISTYVKNGEEIKHSSELTPQELSYDNIVNKYFGAMVKYNGKVFIQPTVFTDKNTHNALSVDLNAPVNIDTFTKKHTNVRLIDLDMETIKGAMFNNNYKYYRNLGRRLKVPYENAINKYRETIGQDPIKISDTNTIKQIHNELRNIPENMFRQAFYQVNGSNFGLIEDLGISKYKDAFGSYIGLSETLVHFSDIYSAPNKGEDSTEKYDTMMSENLDSFAQNLSEFGIKIPFIKRGHPDEILESVLEKLFPDITLAEYVKNWVDGAGNLIIRNKKNEVNPLIEHFFWMDNFISDNFQQLSMGTIHNHPTKGNIDPKKDRMEQVTSLKTAMMFKRQLQGTPMTPFLHKLINGIPDNTKTVYLADIQKSVFNSYWNRDNMKTSDGMSITPMLQIILQNNSLLDNKVGVNMKTLGLTIDPYYNSFGLMKHAEFGATNEWTKRSAGNQYDLKKLYEQAYGIPLNTTLSTGKQYIPNLLKDFNKRDIAVSDIAADGLFFTNENNEIIELLEITHSSSFKDADGNIVSAEKGNYTFKYFNRTTGETYTETKPVTNLYDLWISLGAENSVSLDPEGFLKDSNGESFTYSDSSHFALGEFVNRIGIYLNNDGKKYLKEQGFNDTEIAELIKKPFGDFDKSSIIPTQNEVWQPLKSKFIGKYVFASAQKSGASSVLPAIYAFNKEKVKAETGQDIIIHTNVSMLSTGVLMDADHHVEDSEITEMSQIISALIFNGDTYPIAKDAYESLANVVYIKLKSFTDGIAEFKQIKDKSKLYKEVTKLLVRTFENQKQQSIAAFIGDLAKKDMLNSAKTNESVKEQIKLEASQIENEEEGISELIESYVESGSKLPFSAYIYNTFISLLSNNLNKEAIKRKHPGIASVLKPSGGIVQVYDTIDGKTITSDVFKRNPIVEKQLIDISNVSLFDWVEINEEIKGENISSRDSDFARKLTNVGNTIGLVYKGLSYINSEHAYQTWKSGEFNQQGYDLKGGKVRGGKIGDTFSIMIDIITEKLKQNPGLIQGINERGGLEYIQKSTHNVIGDKFWESSGENKFIEALYQAAKNVKVKENKSEEIYIDTPTKLIEFKKSVKGKVFKIYGKPRDLKPVEVKFTIPALGDRRMSIYETEEFELVHGILNIFDEKQTEEQLAALLKKQGINNKKFIELLLPYFPTLTSKTLTTAFVFENKSKISQIFKNKIQSILRTVEVDKKITINGKVYDISKVETIPGEALGPNIYRTNFGLPKGISTDEVTKDLFTELLAKNSLPETKDSNWFIRNINGKHVYVFTRSQYETFKTNFSEQDLNVSEIDGKRWVVDEFGDKEYSIDGLEFYKYRTNGGKVLDAVVVDDLDLELGSIKKMMASKGKNSSELIINDDISVKQSLLDIDKKATEIYNSYLLSLEFASARIPGQGPQSFTPLKLVDFIHTESNTIMTNHFTSWLKGEDYDIDKGFWMGISFNDGKFVGWSKYFDYSTLEGLKNSTKLPMPDGRIRLFNPTFETSSLVLSKAEYESLFSGEMTQLKANTFAKIGRVKDFHVIGLNPTQQEELQTLVTDYFMEVLDVDLMGQMVKNKVSRSISEMISAPVNQVHAESPIDLGEPQDAAKRASSEVINNYNPATKALLQHANMVGKEVIGIAAVGLKVWSALSYWGNSKIVDGKYKDIAINKDVTLNGKTYTFPVIANLNFNNIVKSIVDDNYLKKYKSVHPETSEIQDEVLRENLENEQRTKQFQEFYSFIESSLSNKGSIKVDKIVREAKERFLLNNDQSLVLSALLSAATDNAKELILAKINAGPETAGVYAYLTMLGVPFTEISNMMISDDVKWVIKNSRSNIFDKSTTGRKIKTAAKTFINGPNEFSIISDISKIFTIEDWARKIVISNAAALGISDQNKAKLSFRGKTPPLSIFNFTNLRELTDNNNGKIKSILNLLSSKLPDQLAPVSTGSMSEEEAEMFMENFGGDGESYGVKGLYVKAEIHTLLETFNNYITETGIPDSSRIAEMNDFLNIYNDSQEITLLGKMLSINQGARTDAYGQYSFYTAVDSFVKNRLDEFSKIVVDNHGEEYTWNKSRKMYLDKEGVAINNDDTFKSKIVIIAETLGHEKFQKYLSEFSFEDFLNASEEDKQGYIEAYNFIKHTFNIFDIIESVPHFKAMLQVPVVIEDIKNILAVKNRLIKKLTKEIYYNDIISPKEVITREEEFFVTNIYPKISDKNFAKMSSFCDDVLIVKWLRQLKEDKRTITYKANGEYKIVDGKLQYVEFTNNAKDVTIDIATVEGRRNFIDMFHNIILKLKRDERYKDNNFIQSLMIDWKEDPLTGREYQYYRLPINLLAVNEHTRSLYNSYVSGFNNLDGDMVEGTSLSLKDIIFLYDTILNRTKVNRTSFAKLFEEDNNKSKETMIYNYIKTISNMDLNDVAVLSTNDTLDTPDYDPYDLITKGFAERIFSSELDKNKGKYAYAILLDDNDNKYIQYYVWDKDVSEYKEYPHFADSLSIPLQSNSALSIQRSSENRQMVMNSIKKLISLGNKINFKIEC